MLFKFIFPLFFLFAAIAAGEHQMTNNSGDQTQVFIKLVQSSMPLPRPAAGKPVVVKIGADIKRVSINQDKKQLETTFFLRQEWNDSRLAFKSEDKDESRVVENPETIWTPDLFFVNGDVSERDDDKTNNTSIKRFPNGRVLITERKTVTTTCSADLRAYPFDTLTCPLKIESYGHTVKDIIVQWNETHYEPAVTGRLLTHDFVTSIVAELDVTTFRGYKFSCPTMVFTVSRTPSAIFFRVILPLVMITTCTWLSFLLSWGEHVLRLSLYLTPLLTYFLQINFCLAFFISPRYLTGLDIWGATCIVAMFISGVESIYIAYKKVPENNIQERAPEKFDLIDRIALALFVSLLDVISIVSVFLSRLF